MAVIRVDWLTNNAYGFPARGAKRRFAPKVAAVVHITGNANNFGDGITYAQNERDYANRRASPGPSAHWYMARDGSAIHAIDETLYAAWSNGDLDHPDSLNTGVRYLVGLKARGYNANEGVGVEIENVGKATIAGQITPAQFDTMADVIAASCKHWKLAPSRTTILTHADINSIDRQNCAFLARTREAMMSRLIDMVSERVGTEPVPALDWITVGDAKGEVTVSEDGVATINLATSARVNVPKGTKFDVVARIHLVKPLDDAAGNRSEGFLTSGVPRLLLAQNVDGPWT